MERSLDAAKKVVEREVAWRRAAEGVTKTLRSFDERQEELASQIERAIEHTHGQLLDARPELRSSRLRTLDDVLKHSEDAALEIQDEAARLERELVETGEASADELAAKVREDAAFEATAYELQITVENLQGQLAHAEARLEEAAQLEQYVNELELQLQEVQHSEEVLQMRLENKPSSGEKLQGHDGFKTVHAQVSVLEHEVTELKKIGDQQRAELLKFKELEMVGTERMEVLQRHNIELKREMTNLAAKLKIAVEDGNEQKRLKVHAEDTSCRLQAQLATLKDELANESRTRLQLQRRLEEPHTIDANAQFESEDALRRHYERQIGELHIRQQDEIRRVRSDANSEIARTKAMIDDECRRVRSDATNELQRQKASLEQRVQMDVATERANLQQQFETQLVHEGERLRREANSQLCSIEANLRRTSPSSAIRRRHALPELVPQLGRLSPPPVTPFAEQVWRPSSKTIVPQWLPSGAAAWPIANGETHMVPDRGSLSSRVQTLGEAMDCATGAQRKAEQAIDKVVARQRENKQADDAIDEVLTSFEWTPL